MQVLDGLYWHLVGQIVNVSQSVATLWFISKDYSILILLNSLVLHFEQDNVVKIISGEHKDCHGCV